MNFDLLGGTSSEASMSVLDEDLTFLATQAAIELDELMRGESISVEAIPKLSDVISNSVKSYNVSGRSASLDPATATVINRAFIDSNIADLSTVDELIQKSLELAGTLQSQVQPDQRNGDMASLKKFCLALARCSAAYRESVLGNRPIHPFRK